MYNAPRSLTLRRKSQFPAEDMCECVRGKVCDFALDHSDLTGCVFGGLSLIHVLLLVFVWLVGRNCGVLIPSGRVAASVLFGWNIKCVLHGWTCSPKRASSHTTREFCFYSSHEMPWLLDGTNQEIVWPREMTVEQDEIKFLVITSSYMYIDWYKWNMGIIMVYLLWHNPHPPIGPRNKMCNS